MSKVNKIEFILIGSAPSKCERGHSIEVKGTASLNPFEPAAFWDLMTKMTTVWVSCEECIKTVTPPIPPEMRGMVTFHVVRHCHLECGHIPRVSLQVGSTPGGEQIGVIKEGDDYPCSYCSSNAAKELETSGAIDMDSATKHYHDAMTDRAAESTVASKPVEFFTEEEVKKMEGTTASIVPRDLSPMQAPASDSIAPDRQSKE